MGQLTRRVRIDDPESQLGEDTLEALTEAGWVVVDADAGVVVTIGGGSPDGRGGCWVAVVERLGEVVTAVRAGARGVVPRSEVDTLPSVLSLVVRGLRVLPHLEVLASLAGEELSPEQRELLEMLVEGYTDAEIGARLGYSRRQAQRVLRSTLGDLGVGGGRREALVVAGLLGVGP